MYGSSTPRGTLLSAVIASLLVPAPGQAEPAAAAPAVSFNRAFLDATTARNIRRYEHGALLPAGDYTLDVWLNKSFVGARRLRLTEDGAASAPCISWALLADLGVTAARSALADGEDADTCQDLAALIEHASAHLTASTLQLHLSVPQAALDRVPRGHAEQSQWEDGVTAASIAYTLSSYRRDAPGTGSALSSTLRTSTRLSTGGWRLRHDANHHQRQGARGHLQTIAASARHDISALNSQLALGRLHSVGDLFEPVTFDGVQISTDTRMLPDSMTGFAPVVRGIARSNAQVVIRQSGFVVHEVAVPPGPFIINDLYASGFAGDLEVTITESDGSTQRFVVPYASVPRLLRPGQGRYAIVAGQLRHSDPSTHHTALRFLEGTYQHGLSNHLTGFTGLQVTEDGQYLSALGGAALNTLPGALSLDLTWSRVELANTQRTRTGQSVRATFSKSLPSTGTSIAVAAYRYSSEHYLSLSQAAMLFDAAVPVQQTPFLPQQRRSTFQLMVNQTLGNAYGTVYASGSSSRYWNRAGADTTFQMGYANRLGNGDYTLAAARSRDASGRADTQFSLSYAVPLWRSAEAPRASLRLDQQAQDTRITAGINGSAGSNHQYNYDLSAAAATHQPAAWALGGGYSAPYAQFNGSIGRDASASAQSFTVSGGVVGHRGGLTLAPQISDTMAIVHAPGAAGARVGSYGKVDQRGYAVANSLRPYRRNSVTIDPSNAEAMIELSSTRQHTTPRAGAITWLHFGGGQQRMQLIPARFSNGDSLPFAADVYGEDGTLIGQVAQGSLIYVRDAGENAVLRVQWSDDASGYCTLAQDRNGTPGAAASCHTPADNLNQLEPR